MDLIACPNCRIINPTGATICASCTAQIDNHQDNYQRYFFKGDQAYENLVKTISRYSFPFIDLLFYLCFIMGALFIIYPFYLNSTSIFVATFFSSLFFFACLAFKRQKISNAEEIILESSLIYAYFSAFLICFSIFVVGELVINDKILSEKLVVNSYLLIFLILSIIFLILFLNEYPRVRINNQGIIISRKKLLIPWSEIDYVYSVNYYKARLPNDKRQNYRKQFRIQLKSAFLNKYKELQLIGNVLAINWLRYSLNMSDLLNYVSKQNVTVEKRLLTVIQVRN